MIKRFLRPVVCLVLVLSLMTTGLVQASGTATALTPGTYTVETIGYAGPMTIEVTLDATSIVDVRVLSHMDTPGIGCIAVEQTPAAIVEHQSLAVDVVSGVTLTSMAIIFAVTSAITEAGGNPAQWRTPVERAPDPDKELTADIVIVGGGGAGLAAAVAATNEGASVILIEKMGFLGGNSIVVGGIYNSNNPDLQDFNFQDTRSDAIDGLILEALEEDPISPEHAELIEIVRAEFEEYLESDRTLFDSHNWFALQMWRGGDQVADLGKVRIMTENALPSMRWLESMGMEFQDVITIGAGSLYARTHRAVLPNGIGFINAFTDTLETAANYTLLMDTRATSLIMDGDTVVGVNAVGRDGNQVTLNANNGVILATGGFAGNVELRQYFGEGVLWPYLGPTLADSNMPGVTGDGLFMAEAVGAALVNMYHIQLLHVCNPYTGATYDIIPGAQIFVNQEGLRFVREDGRRDDMSQAILDQTGGRMFQIGSSDAIGDPETWTALGGQTLAFYLSIGHSGYTVADTLEELAEKMGIPPAALVQTVEEYNRYVESGTTDSFGRATFAPQMLIGPWYAFPRAPAVHHTMGGVLVDHETRVLREDGSAIEGLFAAGEITGVVHGSNRLGGNAIVDFVVFGRIAGEVAAQGR